MNKSMHEHVTGMVMDVATTTAMMMMNNTGGSHDHHNHHNHHDMNMNMTGSGNSTSMGGDGMMMGGGGDHNHGGGMHNGGGGGGGGGGDMNMDNSGHDMSGMGGMGHMGMDMGMDMKMYFHTGIKEFILFEECKTDTNRDMIVACVVIFFVAIMYEGLKFVREVLLQHSLQDRSRNYYDTKMSAAGNSQEHMVVRGPSMSVSSQMLSGSHAVQTILHVVQVFISYCLMLVFMTYNAWLCISVIVGAGVGYFIFGWKRAVVVDSNEHCH